MKLNRILCPIDYSVFSMAANFYASLLADAFGAEIIYCNVAYPSTNERNTEDVLDSPYLDLSTKVKPFVVDVRHRFEVRDGEPAKEILKLAADERVDLIVMGTHGRTGSIRILHGSVCEKVLRHSTCPVMAVKSTINSRMFLSQDGHESGGEAGWTMSTNMD